MVCVCVCVCSFLHLCMCVFVSNTGSEKIKKARGHLDLNQGPLDLQSNALPLSYTPNLHH